MLVGIGRNVHKLSRLVVALLFTLAAAFVLTVGQAAPAHADSGEYINSLKINYSVNTAGVLSVHETFDWHFDPSTTHHGIIRTLVTREADTDNNAKDKDIVYDISDFTVTSPTGASTEVDESGVGGMMSRDRYNEYQIGDPNETVDDEETYDISYQVKGAIRSSGSYDELYWDAIASENGNPTPEIKSLQVTSSVPGGAQGATCYAGQIGSHAPCSGQASVSGQQAVASASDVASGDTVTIGVKIKPGLIKDNKAHLVRKAGLLSAITSPVVAIPGVIVLLITAGVPVAGHRVAKSRSTDLRYIGLAPGTVPLAGASAEVGKSDPHLQIPVQFTPPPITVAEAGILVDGQVDIRDTAATLVGMAVNGAIKIEDTGSGYQVRLLDPSKARGPHQTAFLSSIFGGRPPGAMTDLSARGSMTSAHKVLVAQTRDLVRQKKWFTKVPRAAGRAAGGGGIVAVGVVGFFILHAAGSLATVSPVLLLLVLPIASVVITCFFVSRAMRRGQRTADGRAVCDHVEGFRQYLATAEADQLRFEEGQDIFSRYLPWAIAFDLADRWQGICQRLVEMGRLPDQSPYWYSGQYDTFGAFNIGYMTGSLSTAAAPAVSSSGNGGFSNSDFGSGGSSFGGGGGFAGGGGGGGGASSW